MFLSSGVVAMVKATLTFRTKRRTLTECLTVCLYVQHILLYVSTPP